MSPANVDAQARGLWPVKFYYFNVGDYAASTRGLTALGHGIYRLLIDEYYTTERPLPDDKRALARVAQTRNMQLLSQVLQRFFTLSDGAWSHPIIDKHILRYIDSAPHREAKQAGVQQRQAKHREARKALFQALASKGCVMGGLTPTPELRAVATKLGVVLTDTMTGNGHGHVTRDVTRDVTTSQRQESISRSGVTPQIGADGENRAGVTPSAAALRAAATAARAKALGIQNAFAGDQRLHELLAAGATDEQFSIACAQAKAVGQSWAYVLHAVAQRMEH